MSHEENGGKAVDKFVEARADAEDGATKAVITAVIANAMVTAAKFIGFAFSGSSALLAEAVHSLADTANQSLLYLGIRRSRRVADKKYPFGYGQERYFWNLVSAVTIFFLGCAYTIMHSLEQMSNGHAPEMSLLAFAIIGFAFLVEGYSFIIAITEFNRQRRAENKGFVKYFKETRDPTTLAVLIEDSVAVLGLLFALLGMVLAAYTGLAIFDTIAALLIALLMGGLAFFLAKTNKKYLLNIADDTLNEQTMAAWTNNQHIQDVRHIHSIVISPSESIVMAEVELREEALFENMSQEDVRRAIAFMAQMNKIRASLELDVSKASDETKHIYIEFVLPENK